MRILNFLLYIFFYFPNSLQWACIIFINTSLLFRLCHIWLFAIHGLQCTRLLSPSLSPKSLLKLRSIEPVMPSNRLILCRPLLLLPSIFPSIRFVSNESAVHIRWPNYWSFSFSISPSNEHPGLTSFRIDWLDLLAVQGTHRSLLQHQSSKASILRHSAS